jgi:hypothetical protein
MRRLQPLHAAAFLIDQDRGVGAAGNRAQFSYKRTKLSGIFDVARKYDKTERLRRFEQLALFGVQPDAGATKNASACHITRVETHG